MDISTILLKGKLARAEAEVKTLKAELEALQIRHAVVYKLSPLAEKFVNLQSPTARDIENLQIRVTEVLEEIENTI